MKESFKISNGIIFRRIENEGMVLIPSRGEMYALSESATILFEALQKENKMNKEQMVSILIEEYDIQSEEIEKDIESFLENMLAGSLVEKV